MTGDFRGKKAGEKGIKWGKRDPTGVERRLGGKRKKGKSPLHGHHWKSTKSGLREGIATVGNCAPYKSRERTTHPKGGG